MSSLPVDALKAAASSAAASYPGVQLVVLFGSAARGKARPDSDADVAILGGGFWEMLAIGSAVTAVLGREPDVVDLATASELLRYHVARDGVLLYEATAGAWPHFQADAAVRYFDLAPIIALCTEGVRRRLEREAAHHE